MNDAVLDVCFRENGIDCGRKSGQIVRAGDKNVFYTAIFHPVEDSCPEFRTLILADPHTEYVLAAVQIGKPH